MNPDRRYFLTLLACALASPALALAPAMSRITAYAFSFAALDGGDIRLADYAGKPILVVNTASFCGYTPQYSGLQQLWSRYRERGLMVIGVPSNDFGGQEPGGPAEIAQTAQRNYKTDFPLTAKAPVKGPNAHPFFKWAALQKLAAPSWNFHKYLVGRDGTIKASFSSAIEPTDPRVIAAIEKELGAP